MTTSNIPNPVPPPQQPSYWFYMMEDQANGKQLWTYCGLGYPVDYEQDTTNEKSWTDLMTAAIPAIQADIDQWGLPNP